MTGRLGVWLLLALAAAVVPTHAVGAQRTVTPTTLTIQYKVLMRVTDSAGLTVTRSAGRTLDATSSPIVMAPGPWTLIAELSDPVPAGIDAFATLPRGGRVKLNSASPRAPVESSSQRCAVCVVLIRWQFVATGPVPASLPPRVRFVLVSGATSVKPNNQ